MIQATCNLCKQPYQIDDSAAGMQIQCPSCGKPITVASAATTPPAPVGAPGSGNPGVVWASQGDRQSFKPGYTNIMCWVYTALTAIGCTMLIYGILAFVSLKFKPVSSMLLLYLPIVPGVLAGASIFTNEAMKHCKERVPTLQMILGLTLVVILSAGPAFTTEAIAKSKVKKALVSAISTQTSPPHFVIGGKAVSLMAVNLGKPDKTRTCQIEAVYSNNRIYTLQAIRNVSKVENISGFPEMKANMVQQNHIAALTKAIQKYPATKKAKIENFKITTQTRPGKYSATARISLGFDLGIIMQVSKQSLAFALTPKSKTEVMAITEVNKVWKEFDKSGETICTRVSLGDEINPSLWNATAYLSGGKDIGIFIQETKTEEGSSLKVFFPPKETAILKINEIITRTGAFDGRSIDERCVNLKKLSTMRANQDAMQAQFVQENPADVIITSNGYDVRVLPGKWSVLYSDQTKRKTGWSVLVPHNYQISADPKDSSIMRGAHKEKIDDVDIDISLTINAKDFSDVSKFSLSDYVDKEKAKWTAQYPSASTSGIESFTTHSGLKGYAYTAKNSKIFRAKYFFKQGNSMAILTFDDQSSTSSSLETAHEMVRTLRYKDNPDESAESN